MMSKITSGKGPTGKSGQGKSGQTVGGAQFRSSVEQSRQAPEAKTVEAVEAREHSAPLPVDRDPQRKRRKPPVFETSHTISLRDALEIQGMSAALLAAGAQGNDGEDEAPGIAVITRDGAQSVNPPAEPLLAFQTIFMDGAQYENWRSGTAEPALTKAVGEMLAGFVSGSGKD
jgi:hypothetical protein